jgi:hypothetical protein
MILAHDPQHYYERQSVNDSIGDKVKLWDKVKSVKNR